MKIVTPRHEVWNLEEWIHFFFVTVYSFCFFFCPSLALSPEMRRNSQGLARPTSLAMRLVQNQIRFLRVTLRFWESLKVSSFLDDSRREEKC